MQISDKQKKSVIVTTVIGAMMLLVWFGERYQPYTHLDRVAQYAGLEIDRAIKEADVPESAPTTSSKKVSPGQQMRPLVYVVKKGDTVYGIARRFRVNPELLKFKNEIGEDGKIIAGQKLSLPQG